MNLDWMQWQDCVNHDRLKKNGDFLNMVILGIKFGIDLWGDVWHTRLNMLRLEIWACDIRHETGNEWKKCLGTQTHFCKFRKKQRNKTQTFLGPMGVTNLWDKSASNKHDSN